MHSLESLTSVSKYQRGFSHFITGERITFSLTNSSFTEFPSPDAMSLSEKNHKNKDGFNENETFKILSCSHVPGFRNTLENP